MCSDCELRAIFDKPVATGVFRGRLVHNDSPVIVKTGNDKHFQRLFREYNQLCLLAPIQGVVKTKGFYIEDSCVNLLLEDAGKDLHDLPPLSEDEVVLLLKQIINTLLQMKREFNTAFNDLSLDNVCYDEKTNKVTLIDLEMSCRPDESRYYFCGKPGYLAPETVEVKEFVDVFAKDVFSLGACVFVLLTNKDFYRQPYDRRFNMLLKPGGLQKLLRQDQKYLGLQFSKEMELFLLQTLDPDPVSRATLEEIQSHPLFTHKSKPSRYNLCYLF
jgi:serine/threonine protein kinase